MLIRRVEGYGIDKSWRPLDDISPHLIRAAMAGEDARFCRHHGFDWGAIATAWDRYQSGHGRLLGASTISMQTAKNVFLWPGRSPLRKVTYFEPVRSRLARKTIPVPPHLARNTIIESTFNVGRRFRCTMRIDCGRLDPSTVIRPILGHWQPRVPEHLDKEELADWLAARNAVYQLTAMTIGARVAVADA